jgi:hypothetical protein
MAFVSFVAAEKETSDISVAIVGRTPPDDDRPLP